MAGAAGWGGATSSPDLMREGLGPVAAGETVEMYEVFLEAELSYERAAGETVEMYEVSLDAELSYGRAAELFGGTCPSPVGQRYCTPVSLLTVLSILRGRQPPGLIYQATKSYISSYRVLSIEPPILVYRAWTSATGSDLSSN
eukprot:353569-Chlamydomonas_euryale.AAC.1